MRHGHGSRPTVSATRSRTVTAGRRGLVAGGILAGHRSLRRADGRGIRDRRRHAKADLRQELRAPRRTIAPVTSGIARCDGAAAHDERHLGLAPASSRPPAGDDDEHLPARRRTLALDVTSPTSRPAFCSASSACCRVMPTTLRHRASCAAPGSRRARSSFPLASRASGSGFWPSTWPDAAPVVEALLARCAVEAQLLQLRWPLRRRSDRPRSAPSRRA